MNLGGDAMGNNAIEAVREAEEKARILLQEANNKVIELTKEAEAIAEEEYQKILSDTELKSKQLKDTAIEEGKAIAKPIIDKGMKDAKALLAMTNKDLKGAVNIIVERVVNANGNS